MSLWPPHRVPLLLLGLAPALASGQTITLDTSPAGRQQEIDGFGTCLSGDGAQQPWFQQLYFDDLQASMLRMDITPQFISPYSDHHYNSPWYSNDPPLPGPDLNNVRTYTNATTYSSSWDSRQAQIAVMGPDIDQNVMLFDYSGTAPTGALAQLGLMKKSQLGDFKLFASMWSPAPWVKITSGNTYGASSAGLPTQGTPWPFIWGGNFAGGMLDVSDTPLPAFNDGTQDTSALTQFARGLAAFLRGFQNTYGVPFYAISIQNELNFEEFYNSATYPLAPAYITALVRARAELQKYPDLASIKIMGPEDLMGSDAYGMWQYGSGSTTVTKNLQYLQAIAQADAGAALDQYCIHGYASDGASAAGATPTSWSWWSQGWTSSPAAGIPANVNGFASTGKKSWMTESSGEDTAWLSPASGFPNQGAWSIALKIHQALTAGQESGWAYWQLSDGNPASAQTLTDVDAGASSPKYVAVKHFFHDIRPGSVRVNATVSGAPNLLASAYVNDAAGSLTVVLVNADSTAVTASLAVPSSPAGINSFTAHTSQDQSYWVPSALSASSGPVSVTVPAYGVVTLVGEGIATGPADAGSPSASTSGAATSATVAGGSASGATSTTGAAGTSSGRSTGASLTAASTTGGAASTKGSSSSSSTAKATGKGCGCGAADGAALLGIFAALGLARRRGSR